MTVLVHTIRPWQKACDSLAIIGVGVREEGSVPLEGATVTSINIIFFFFFFFFAPLSHPFLLRALMMIFCFFLSLFPYYCYHFFKLFSLFGLLWILQTQFFTSPFLLS